MTTTVLPLLIEGESVVSLTVDEALYQAELQLRDATPDLERFLRQHGYYNAVLGYLTECHLAGTKTSIAYTLRYLGLWESVGSWIDSLDEGVQLIEGDVAILEREVERRRSDPVAWKLQEATA